MNSTLHQKGQTLVEVLIGLTIIALGISFAVSLTFGGQGASLDRSHTIKAQSLAQEGLEGSKAIIKSDWDGTSDGNHGLKFSSGSWQFQGTSTTHEGGKFRRQIKISKTNSSKRVVTSTVTWQKRTGINRKVEMTISLTNWSPIAKGCGISGDWDNPTKLGTSTIPNNPETTDLAVQNNSVYLTANPSSGGIEDFYILDTSSPSNITLKSSLNLGEGLKDIEVIGDHAYVVGLDNSKEFQIIDISSSSNPSVVSTHDWSRGADNLTVDVQGDYAYIGTEDFGGPGNSKHELRIIDISSSSNPSIAGSMELDTNVNELVYKNEYVHTALNKKDPEMKTIDVSDTDNLSSAHALDENGEGKGKSIDLGQGAQNSSLLFLGKSRDTKESKSDTNEEEFLSLDISDPENINNKDKTNEPDTVSEIKGVCDLAFLGTKDSSSELMIKDISSPDNIQDKTSIDLSSDVTGIEYENNNIYVSLKSGDALVIISSS